MAVAAVSCLLLALGVLCVGAQKNVIYRVEYSEDPPCTGVNPDPLNLTAQPFDSAINIMEQAVREGGPFYHFSVFFTDQDGVVDYIIDQVNGTKVMPDECLWQFYVRHDNTEVRPDIGISSYIPGDNFHVILRYESMAMALPTIQTRYVIDYSDAVCAPEGDAPEALDVVTSLDARVLDVMEEAVAMSGRAYQFTVNYAPGGDNFAYTIEQVNGVSAEGNCMWYVHLKPPSDPERVLTTAVSQHLITGDDYTLTLQYRVALEPTTPTPTTDSSARGLQGGVSLLVICATLLSLLM